MCLAPSGKRVKLLKNRNGSFKVKVNDLSLLSHEANQLHELFNSLKKDLLNNHITEAQFVGLYILIYQLTRTPKNSLQGIQKKLANKNKQTSLIDFLKSKNMISLIMFFSRIENPHILDLSLIEIFDLNFKGLPQKMNKAMQFWLEDKWPIKLLFYIPSARRLLEMQKKGSRCVTVLTSRESLSSFVLDKRDCLSFVIHDLEHAVNFYEDESLKNGQIGFYHFVDQLLKEKWISELLEKNPDNEFHHLLDYVIADMNAYSVHLVQYLYGILKKFNTSKESCEKNWNSFLEQLILPDHIFAILKNIENSNLTNNEIETLHAWFENYQSP